MDETGNVLMHKVGPLPLIAWVVGASGLVFIFLLIKGQGSSNSSANNQTNSVDSLAPTEAEAFGTIEQQQQDVTNALSTLGNNQSALGGSLSTLTGIVTQQGSDNAAAFQNLANGQQTIEAGQTSAQSSADNYYNSLSQALANYYNSLSGSLNGVNTNVMNVSGQLSGVSGQVNNLGQQLAGVGGQVSSSAAANQSYFQQLVAQLANFQQGQGVWDSTLAQKADYIAAQNNTYLPNIYQKTVMG